MNRLSVYGMVQLSKDAVIEKLKNMGYIQINERLKGRKIKSYGSITGRGRLQTETLLSKGVLQLEGDIEGEELIFKGGVCQAALVNGENVVIEVATICQCHSIGATNLTIKKAAFKSNQRALMVAEEIEGDQLNLRCIRAKVVRGDVIKLGDHSTIERLEYRTLVVSPSKTISVSQSVRS